MILSARTVCRAFFYSLSALRPRWRYHPGGAQPPREGISGHYRLEIDGDDARYAALLHLPGPDAPQLYVGPRQGAVADHVHRETPELALVASLACTISSAAPAAHVDSGAQLPRPNEQSAELKRA